MTSPTPAQVQQVQTNLTNMQAFNDYVYNQGQSKVLNAYLRLSEQDNSDPGLAIGLNILEGAFWAVGSLGGPAGNFAASFLSGMLSWWATDSPPSLNTTFASMEVRLQQTSLALDQQLATYYQDVPGHWDTQFTYNGSTSTLSDFATVSFPAETDPSFETMAATSLVALDQSVWQSVLKSNYVVTYWEPDTTFTDNARQDSPPVGWDESFIAANPAYYNTWNWHHGSGCGDQSGWQVQQYNIGTGAGVFTDGSMSHAACDYLFIDSADGVVINQDGLYDRKTVFTGLGIKTATQIVPSGGGGGPVGESLSTGYLRAMVEGRTLGKLVEREGRAAVERRVIEKAQNDPVFAQELRYRPRQTLEKFLDVRIPEPLSISVIIENGRTFGIVVPPAAGDD